MNHPQIILRHDQRRPRTHPRSSQNSSISAHTRALQWPKLARFARTRRSRFVWHHACIACAARAATNSRRCTSRHVPRIQHAAPSQRCGHTRLVAYQLHLTRTVPSPAQCPFCRSFVESFEDLSAPPPATAMPAPAWDMLVPQIPMPAPQPVPPAASATVPAAPTAVPTAIPMESSPATAVLTAGPTLSGSLLPSLDLSTIAAAVAAAEVATGGGLAGHLRGLTRLEVSLVRFAVRGKRQGPNSGTVGDHLGPHTTYMYTYIYTYIYIYRSPCRR